MGIATAPPSSVAVMTHEALAGVVFSNRGRSVWIGIISVCIRAALIPPKQRTTTVSECRRGSLVLRGPGSSSRSVLSQEIVDVVNHMG